MLMRIFYTELVKGCKRTSHDTNRNEGTHRITPSTHYPLTPQEIFRREILQQLALEHLRRGIVANVLEGLVIQIESSSSNAVTSQKS